MVGSGRPDFHFVAPKGWLNDPCAPGYDEKTGLYHLFYQWNPKSHKWDDISWGHATSRDLISWEYSSQEPAFTPSESYDKLGIFTGCFYPTGPEGQADQLSIFYTNVDYLPIKWDLPYKRGCEGLAMATSVDGGKTWTKYANNPLLSEEPPEIHVTGFRDPFLAPWPAMDKLRGTPGKLYGLISGGIHDLGPRTFLYEVDPKDLTKWTYLHPLTTDVPVGYLPSVKWAGDFGANWECTNFVSLRAHDGTQRELVFTGTEGGKHRPWRDEHYRKQSQEAPRRDPSYANWFIGNLAAAGATSEVRMDIGPTGMIDWGVFYASSSFPAPDGRTVVWGWMQEPDVSDGLLKERGWTGCMGIPREIYLQKISGVIGAFSSPLDTIASFGLEPQTGASSDAHTVYTLGIRPIIETDQLRKDIVYDHPAGPINSTVRCFKTLPAACEIRCILEISKATKDVSFILRHNDDLSIKTSIVFDPHAETLQVIRELSTDRTDISTAPEIGSHTLLRLQSGDGTEERFEPLRLTIYLDHDVIELFANDRFALSTRVYTPPQYTGFSIAAKGDVEVQDLKVWEMGSMGLVR